jgi:TP901 family phage tail tape measure protein
MGGVEAGKAFVKFLLEDSELKKGLRGAGKSMQKFGAIGVAATAPIIAALSGCVATAVQVGGEFADMAARTGVSVEALSELKFAAEQTGTSMGAVEKAMRKSQIAIANSDRDGGKFAGTVRMLGLDINKLRGMRPEDQFTVLATAIGKIPDQGQRAAMAVQVFGKSGAELLPMLTAAEGGVEGLRAKARELGVTLTDEDAAALDDLGDALDGAKAQLVALAVQIGVALAGPLTNFLTWAQGAIANVIAFIKENPKMVKAIAAITLGVAAASAALVTLGTVLTIITLHPIVAFLALLAGLIVGLVTWFGLASTGADDFKKSLDEIKATGQVDPQAQAQAAQVQAQLGAATASPPAMPPAAAERATAIASEGMGEVVKWTRETAEGVQRLVQLAQSTRGGLLGGAF